MGVPGFYRFLVNRYPLIRQRISITPRFLIDNLYIDFNCIVYNCLKTKPNLENDRSELFSEIMRYLDLLVQVIQPKENVIISVDGPAPYAKCSQQRARRFESGKNYSPGRFSHVEISVGTEFMESLHERIKSFIEDRKKNDILWRYPNVLYSSCHVPGEGEHKIFNYIRDYQKSSDYNPDFTHCVYSPDADLIFLCLQTKEEQFYIMREFDAYMYSEDEIGGIPESCQYYSAFDFELLHLPLLRRYLEFDFNTQDSDTIVHDFLALGFLLGNDFIPRFPEFLSKSIDMHDAFQVFTELFLPNGKHLIENGKFNFLNLRDFFIALLNESNPKKRELASYEGSVEYVAQVMKKEHGQYQDAFPETLARSIAEAFVFVKKYYLEGIPSWTWGYKFHFSPPIQILIEWFKHFNEDDFEFQIMKPPKPFTQLMSIIPPKCASLLPNSLSQYMFPPSTLSQYYPQRFEILNPFKAYEYLAVVDIPFIDIQKVGMVVKDVNDSYSENEKIRNSIGEIVSYASIKEDIDFVYPSPSYALFSDFKDKPIGSEKISNCISIFGFKSPLPSIVLRCDALCYETKPSNSIEAYIGLLGKMVLFLYPNYSPGLVVGILNKNSSIKLVNGEIIKEDIDNIGFIAGLTEDVVTRYGLALDSNYPFLSIIPIRNTGLHRCTKSFGDVEMYSSVLHIRKLDEPLLDSYYPCNSTGFNVGDFGIISMGEYIGQYGKIMSIENDLLTVNLSIDRSIPLLSNLFNEDQGEWFSIEDISKETGLEKVVLGNILQGFSVRIGDLKYKVGFGLFNRKNGAIGLTKYVSNKMMFHKSIIPSVHQLVSKYDSIIEVFKNKKIDVLWPTKTQQNECIRDLVNFISSMINTESLFIENSPNTVSHVTAARMISELYRAPEIQEVTVTIPMDCFIKKGMPKREKQVGLKGKMAVSILPSSVYPMGTRGYIIGINSYQRQLYLLSPDPIPYGTKLNGLLKENRGFVLSIDDAIIY